MKAKLILLFPLVCLFLSVSKCPLTPDYSGKYCISAHDHELVIQQTESKVNFTLTADTDSINGSGTVSGQAMNLSAVTSPISLELNLLFSKDGKTFQGEITMSGESSSYNGTKGECVNNYPAGDIDLISPYVNYAEMYSIHKGFGNNPNTPWGDHSGIDIIPANDLMPFRSMSSGKVVEINSNRMSNNLWVTNVVVKYNSTYRVLYAFENLTADVNDRDIQLANLAVKVGQIDVTGLNQSSF